METLLIIVVWIARVLVYTELAALFASVVLSWVMPDGEGVIFNIIYYITEPILIPVRSLLYRIPEIEESPIDLPLLVACMIFTFVAVFI